ncbi:MAG: TIM barrel protein [Granulosicoccus sp.]
MKTTFEFSANTGFLYPELSFIERIYAAHKDGYDAVEFHDEAQSVDLSKLKTCLNDTDLPVVGLNIRMGATAGCAAMAEQHDQAMRDIDAAIEMADATGAGAIHVLAGKTQAADAHDTFATSLAYALDQTDCVILIEPLCQEKMPGYFLRTVEQAARILDEVGNTRLQILFDCFHVRAEHGSVLETYERYSNMVGHIQIASYPDRSEPESGQAAALDYAELLTAFRRAGYSGLFGCEYTAKSVHAERLDWRIALGGK